MKAKRYCMGSEDHYDCIYRTKDDRCTGEIGICTEQSIAPKMKNPVLMPKVKPCKAEDVCVGTCDNTISSQIIEEMNKTLTIRCERIVLQQDSIGIDVDVPKGFDAINTIMINGVKFVKNNGEI